MRNVYQWHFEGGKKAIKPAKAQLKNPLILQYIWLRVPEIFVHSPLKVVPLHTWTQLLPGRLIPLHTTDAKLFLSRTRCTINVSEIPHWSWCPLDQCLKRQGWVDSKNHNMEAVKVLLDMEEGVKQCTSTSTLVPPSCWVPCLIGHKGVPAFLASLVSAESKIRNSGIYLSTYFQLQYGKWNGRVEESKRERRRKLNLWLNQNDKNRNAGFEINKKTTLTLKSTCTYS